MAATARQEEEAEVAFVAARGSCGREGSATSVARGLLGRPFVTSDSNLCFISKGQLTVKG